MWFKGAARPVSFFGLMVLWFDDAGFVFFVDTLYISCFTSTNEAVLCDRSFRLSVCHSVSSITEQVMSRFH